MQMSVYFSVKKTFLYLFSCLVLVIGIPSYSFAIFVTSDPSLPPIGGEYEKPDPIRIASLGVDITDIKHSQFTNITRSDNGTDEFEVFDSVLEFFIDNGLNKDPIVLTGQVNTTVFGKVGQTTGTFDTEITAMNLVGLNQFVTGLGFVEIMLKETPTSASTGKTTITPEPPNPPVCPVAPCFRIDSFFDVFFDLTFVGGVNTPIEIPNVGPNRITLQWNVPEPGMAVMMGIGLVGLGYSKGRRRI